MLTIHDIILSCMDGITRMLLDVSNIQYAHFILAYIHALQVELYSWYFSGRMGPSWIYRNVENETDMKFPNHLLLDHSDLLLFCWWASGFLLLNTHIIPIGYLSSWKAWHVWRTTLHPQCLYGRQVCCKMWRIMEPQDSMVSKKGKDVIELSKAQVLCTAEEFEDASISGSNKECNTELTEPSPCKLEVEENSSKTSRLFSV